MPVDWDREVIAPNIDVFGETVTVKLCGVPPFTCLGVFDEAYREVDLAGGTPVTTVMPVLGVRLRDMPRTPRQDDSFSARQRDYLIKEVQVDSHGWALLKSNLVGPCC